MLSIAATATPSQIPLSQKGLLSGQQRHVRCLTMLSYFRFRFWYGPVFCEATCR